MANSSLLLDIEQNVKCPVCLEVFIDPVMLECQHSLCKKCVNVLMIFDRVNCPQCRAVTTASKLKDNLLQKTLVEVFNKSQQGVKNLVCNRRGKKRDAEGQIVSDNTDTVDENDGLCDFCKSFKAELYCSDCKNMVCKACQQCHRIFTHCKDVSVKSLRDIISDNHELLHDKLTEVQNVTDTIEEKIASAIEERVKDRENLLQKVNELKTEMLGRVKDYWDSQENFIEEATDDCIEQLQKSRDEAVKNLESRCRKELEEVKTNTLLRKPQFIENVVANVNEAIQSTKEAKIPCNKIVFQGACRKFPNFSIAPRMVFHAEDNGNQGLSLHQLTYRKFYLQKKVAIPVKVTTTCEAFFYQGKIWTIGHKKNLQWIDPATLTPSRIADVVDTSTINYPMNVTIHGSYVFINAHNGFFVFNGKKVNRLLYGYYHCVNVLEEHICALRQEGGNFFIDLLNVTEVNGVIECNTIEEVVTELPTGMGILSSVAVKGKLFICSTRFCCIYVTDLKTGKILDKISAEHFEFQCPKDWPSLGSTDGKYVLIYGLGHNLKLCDLTDPCYPLYTVDIVEGRCEFVSAILLPDGRLICTNGSSLYVYD